VIASFDAAQASIDVAMYQFAWEPLVEALVRALARGVRVRLVTDTDSLGDEAIQRLRDAGVPVVDDGRAALMHDKFVVVDGSVVWTGSLNFTRNDAYRNNNVFIQIRSARLAQNYTAEFEEMFAQRAFGPQSPADTPNPVVRLDGTEVENYFSPEDGVARRILSLLNGAQRSIYFMAFAFTRQDFAEALLGRASHGVTVKGVFEASQLTESGDLAWSLLTGGGLAANVRQDGNPYNLHTKVFIVDEDAVVLGSYNFSRNAEEANDENVLIIHNADIARAMLAEWQRAWDKAGD
jgi:phosphatidylserine/phosphatidylglycerophosphate/cardiolipin synthase-like enzyme